MHYISLKQKYHQLEEDVEKQAKISRNEYGMHEVIPASSYEFLAKTRAISYYDA